MSRNPNWTKEELILALDVYEKINFGINRKNHPKIRSLSELLRKIPIHKNIPNEKTFRNEKSVYMKLSNFIRFDSRNSGIGLSRGGKLDKEIYDAFWNKKDLLKLTAESIIKNYTNYSTINSNILIDNEEIFIEGKILTISHKVRERNPSLVKKKKKKILQETGKLICEICGFDFERVFGEYGRGFIECHHRVPLYKLGEITETKLKDLALVCANCHRMLHRIRPWITTKNLKEIITIKGELYQCPP